VAECALPSCDVGLTRPRSLPCFSLERPAQAPRRPVHERRSYEPAYLDCRSMLECHRFANLRRAHQTGQLSRRDLSPGRRSAADPITSACATADQEHYARRSLVGKIVWESQIIWQKSAVDLVAQWHGSMRGPGSGLWIHGQCEDQGPVCVRWKADS
jgi:hypothetical protein